MDVCAAGDSLLCVTDEARAYAFYIAKHVTRRSGRRAGYRLAAIALARVGADAGERLDGRGPAGKRARIATTCSASWGRPYALSAKVLAGWNSTQKRQIINGIVGSIYTLHHFMPPLPYRGLRPGCYYVCRRE